MFKKDGHFQEIRRAIIWLALGESGFSSTEMHDGIGTLFPPNAKKKRSFVLVRKWIWITVSHFKYDKCIQIKFIPNWEWTYLIVNDAISGVESSYCKTIYDNFVMPVHIKVHEKLTLLKDWAVEASCAQGLKGENKK